MQENTFFHPNELLNIWEQGFNKNSQQKTNDLISLYVGLAESEEIKSFSIEQKEQYLLEIRRLLFGRKFLSIANCPSCSEMIEWEMNYSDFLNVNKKVDLKKRYICNVLGYVIHYRLPNEKDISLYEKNQILKNCVFLVKKNNKEIKVDNVPSALWDKLEIEMEKSSPLSSSTINLSCPKCENKWQLYFSIIDFLWTELDQWAKRFLYDVSILARAYGWSESEIINMNPIRRSYYRNLLIT